LLTTLVDGLNEPALPETAEISLHECHGVSKRILVFGVPKEGRASKATPSISTISIFKCFFSVEVLSAFGEIGF